MKKIDVLLVTGASGTVATLLRPMLASIANHIRLSDLTKSINLQPYESFVSADLSIMSDVENVVAGVNGILHLGGQATEADFDTILQANIIGVQHLFAAAQLHGQPRIIFASSNHVVGYYSAADVIDASALPRPDSYYGVSKVFGETMAQMFFDKLGQETAIVRIGSCFPKPTDPRMLSTWFSASDFCRLISVCFSVDKLGCPIIYGASNNPRTFWDNRLVEYLGWSPVESAEFYSNELGTNEAITAAETKGLMDYHGGLWVAAPLIEK